MNEYLAKRLLQENSPSKIEKQEFTLDYEEEENNVCGWAAYNTNIFSDQTNILHKY